METGRGNGSKGERVSHRWHVLLLLFLLLAALARSFLFGGFFLDGLLRFLLLLHRLNQHFSSGYTRTWPKRDPRKGLETIKERYLSGVRNHERLPMLYRDTPRVGGDNTRPSHRLGICGGDIRPEKRESDSAAESASSKWVGKLNWQAATSSKAGAV